MSPSQTPPKDKSSCGIDPGAESFPSDEPVSATYFENWQPETVGESAHAREDKTFPPRLKGNRFTLKAVNFLAHAVILLQKAAIECVLQ
jgi:hypothetical protein